MNKNDDPTTGETEYIIYIQTGIYAQDYDDQTGWPYLKDGRYLLVLHFFFFFYQKELKQLSLMRLPLGCYIWNLQTFSNNLFFRYD